ncbi:cell wall-binding repeat-containing protein [Salipaludibacillus sp. CF4.18]|uniref:cell wall-binding repeat-containing protein n=1 Tax=Salipaludibacillus sp. CF4.18 TaxID=3373081 RepID=UPI003EE765C7
MQKVIAIFSTVLVFLIVFSGETHAMEQTFDQEGQFEQQLKDGLSVIVNNEPFDSTVTFLDNQEKLYTKEIQLGYAEGIYEFKDYYIVSNRIDGSGGFLNFDVYETSDENVNLIFQSQAYKKGKLSVEDGLIKVSFSDDENSLLVDEYAIEDGETSLINSFEEDSETQFGFAAASQYSNPPYHEIDKLLTEKALDANVPPEIVKAIAYQESAWDHYKNGEPNVSNDGGVGIMQVTDQKYNQEKLTHDIEYNIEIGIKLLLEKKAWADSKKIPKINDDSAEIIDHWYFAVMAYNGLVQTNSPIKSEDGERNTDAYQEKVFQKISTTNNGIGFTSLPISLSDLDYKTGGQLGFHTLSYSLKQVQPTRYDVEKNSFITLTSNANLREKPLIGDNIKKELVKGDILTVLDSFSYGESRPFNRANQFVWYYVEQSNGTKGYVASGTVKPLGKRVSGSSRFETAVEISRQGWEQGAETVVLATGMDYPDALAGGPLAYKHNAPILLSLKDRLTAATKKEIARLEPSKIIILGGVGAIGDEVKLELEDMGLGISIDRIAGSNRSETARSIAEELGTVDKAIVAYGWNFPDALAIAPYAAKMGYPILLTQTNRLPDATVDFLSSVEETIVVGGTSIIPKEQLDEMNNPDRISGPNRYETALEIVEKLNMGKPKVLLATGQNYADALTGSVLAAKQDRPVLLVHSEFVPSAVGKYLNNQVIWDYTVIGGRAAISPDVLKELN